VPVNADGSAGKPQNYVASAEFRRGADGIDIDSGGNIFAAVSQQNRIVMIRPDHSIAIVAEGPPLQQHAE